MERRLKLTAAVTHEPPLYVARCLEVEVASQGASQDEALENLKEALQLFFEDQGPLADFEAPVIVPLEISA